MRDPDFIITAYLGKHRAVKPVAGATLSGRGVTPLTSGGYAITAAAYARLEQIYRFAPSSEWPHD